MIKLQWSIGSCLRTNFFDDYASTLTLWIEKKWIFHIIQIAKTKRILFFLSFDNNHFCHFYSRTEKHYCVLERNSHNISHLFVDMRNAFIRKFQFQALQHTTFSTDNSIFAQTYFIAFHFLSKHSLDILIDWKMHAIWIVW